MTSSADLAYRLKHNPIPVDGTGPLGGWEDSYITPGHTHECHPDFVATPIGDSPYGFLVCQRKKTPNGHVLEHAKRGSRVGIHATPHQTNQRYRPILEDRGYALTQSHHVYDAKRKAHASRTDLGGQPRYLPDRRPLHQAHLQGVDYNKDCIRYRGIGIEKIETYPGQFSHQENKYYHSAPPPKYDITHTVQPYDLWKREQLRNKHFTDSEMNNIDNAHTFTAQSATF